MGRVDVERQTLSIKSLDILLWVKPEQQKKLHEGIEID